MPGRVETQQFAVRAGHEVRYDASVCFGPTMRASTSRTDPAGVVLAVVPTAAGLIAGGVVWSIAAQIAQASVNDRLAPSCVTGRDDPVSSGVVAVEAVEDIVAVAHARRRAARRPETGTTNLSGTRKSEAIVRAEKRTSGGSMASRIFRTRSARPSRRSPRRSPVLTPAISLPEARATAISAGATARRPSALDAPLAWRRIRQGCQASLGRRR